MPQQRNCSPMKCRPMATGSGVASRAVHGRTQWWAFAAVFALCTTAYVANLGSLQIGQHVDDSIYISVGRALQAGLGYVRYEDPTHPHEQQYPPGLPGLVAAVLWVSDGRIAALRLIPLVFSLASLFLADAFFRTRLPVGPDGRPVAAWRWLLAALFGLNHLVVGYAGMVMTEAPFVCLTLATLVWLDRRDHQRTANPETPASATWVLAMVLILVTGCLLRTIGWALVAATGLWLWQRREPRTALIVVVVSIALLSPWMVAQHSWTGTWFGSGYQADITANAGMKWHPLLRPVENLSVYASTLLPEAVLPFFGNRMSALCARASMGFIPGLIGSVFSTVILLGGVILARRRSDPADWVFVALALILLIWPFRYTRFCLPLVPIALVYLVAGGYLLTPRRRWWVWAVAGLALVGFLARDAEMVVNPPHRDYPDIAALGHFVEKHTPPAATVLTTLPSAIGLYAERGVMDLHSDKTTGGPAEMTPAEFLARSAGREPRYVLLYPQRPGEAVEIPEFLKRAPFKHEADEARLGAQLFRIEP